MPKLKRKALDLSLVAVLLAYWLAVPVGAGIAFLGIQQEQPTSYTIELVAFLTLAVFGLVGVDPDNKKPIVLGIVSATLGTFFGAAVTFAAMRVNIQMQAFICALVTFHYGEFACNCCFQNRDSIT
ncbi:hypothetical protein FOZ63_006336 [Perkinsus olseni]|uniref:Uncharacterized protein n=1 Tax=Perkinsus olseni TaxID=32597 RepID=A0A7J6RZ56_PEROL